MEDWEKLTIVHCLVRRYKELLEDLDVVVEHEGVKGDAGEAAGHPEDGEDERARADGEAAAVGETLRRHLGSVGAFSGVYRDGTRHTRLQK